MTRKQAIEVLQTYDMSEDNEDKEFIEAIKMAIKALEQEPIDCANAEHDVDGCLGYSTDRGGYSYCQTCLECPKASINNWDKEQEPNCPFYEIDDDGHGLCKNHRYMDECDSSVQRTSNADKKHVENTLDDTISREAVLEAISEVVTLEKYIGKDNHVTFEPLEQMINNLPPVQPTDDEIQKIQELEQAEIQKAYELGKAERQTGKWVEIDEEPHEVWECDHCGFVIDGSGCIDPIEYRDTYKYCPNCGAHMVEPYKADKE